jgi:hypothetical protein
MSDNMLSGKMLIYGVDKLWWWDYFSSKMINKVQIFFDMGSGLLEEYTYNKLNWIGSIKTTCYKYGFRVVPMKLEGKATLYMNFDNHSYLEYEDVRRNTVFKIIGVPNSYNYILNWDPNVLDYSDVKDIAVLLISFHIRFFYD